MFTIGYWNFISHHTITFWGKPEWAPLNQEPQQKHVASDIPYHDGMIKHVCSKGWHSISICMHGHHMEDGSISDTSIPLPHDWSNQFKRAGAAVT